MKHTAEVSPHMSAGLDMAREFRLPCVAIRKIPANAHQTHYFSSLAAGDFWGVGLSKNGWTENLLVEVEGWSYNEGEYCTK